MSTRTDIKLQGFAPDLDISMAGVITSSTNLIPTVNGFSPLNSQVSAGFPALASACRGIVSVRKKDDSRRLLAGTQTKLYEGAGTSWTDVSAGSYTGGAENRWRFTQQGDVTIATNRVDAMQYSSSGAFAAIAGAPKASIVETCENFVLAFDYNDGVNDYPDGWYCSALGNYASWSPSIATQAANGRLLSTPGSLRAAKALGNIMVAYKERSMYLGFYDGPPIIWRWQLVPGDIGCVSQEAIQVVVIGDQPMHIFAGFDGFYIFDGTRPRFIGNPLKKWYNTNASAQYRYKIQSLHDPLTQNVYFYLCDGSGNVNYGVVYNYLADRWSSLGPITPIEAAVQYLSAGITYDSLGTYYSTYDNLPSIAYDSPFWVSGAPTPAVVNNDHILYTYTGTPTSATITCGYTGDLTYFNSLIRIYPRFNQYPTSGSCTISYTKNLGDSAPLTIAAGTLTDGKHDVLISSQWFSPSFTYNGNFEMTGYTMMLEQDGQE